MRTHGRQHHDQNSNLRPNAQEAEIPELTAELLADSAAPLDPVISPDGRLVAYVVAAPGAAERRFSALWVAPADSGSPGRMLTASAAWDRVPRWAPDSASIFFASDQELRRIRVDGSDARLVTWRGEIRDLVPLADGRLAVIASDEPDADAERRRAERDDAMVWGQDVPASRLRLLDPRGGDLDCDDPHGGELRLVSGLGDRHVREAVQRPDGGPLAVISWACPQDEPGAFTARLHVVDLASGNVDDLGPIGLDGRSPAWWSATDGWHLAYGWPAAGAVRRRARYRAVPARPRSAAFQPGIR